MKALAARLMADPDFEQVKALVAKLTGMVFYADKGESLAAIVARRMQACGQRDLAAYLAWLQDRRHGPEEREALIADLTIGETYFFRHHAQWEALEHVILPELIGRHAASRRLRFWSAACAAGAEPYSLAILLRDRFGKELEGWNVSILGTDINRRFLSEAQAGRYSAWFFRATPDALRETWFSRNGAAWEIDPAIRQLVQFQAHNLVSDPIPPGRGEPFDLILCRNVMIYFDQPTIRRLATALHGALAEGGWLVVGHAEASIPAFQDFSTVMLPGTSLHRKSDGAPVRKPPVRAPAPPAVRTAPPASARPPARPPVQPPARPMAPQGRNPPARERKPVVPAPTETVPGLLPDSAIRDLIGRGAWAEAEAALAARLEHDPLDARAHVLQGILLDQRGDAAGSEAAFRRAVFLDRRSVLAHYHLGDLWRRKGDRAGAERSFRNVLSLLAPLEDGTTLDDADDLTAGTLRKAAAFQLRMVEMR